MKGIRSYIKQKIAEGTFNAETTKAKLIDMETALTTAEESLETATTALGEMTTRATEAEAVVETLRDEATTAQSDYEELAEENRVLRQETPPKKTNTTGATDDLSNANVGAVNRDPFFAKAEAKAKRIGLMSNAVKKPVEKKEEVK